MNLQINYISLQNVYGERYRVSYSCLGNPVADKVVLCLHGLNRNNRDFDFIAEYLVAQGYYVLAPDLPGRGNSDYLNDIRGYSLEANVADILQFIQQLGLRKFALIGVSLGGIIGMLLAAQPGSGVAKLVLSDIGAEVELAGIARIARYSHEQPDFADFSEASAYLRTLAQSDGIFAEEIWQHLFANSFQKNLRGRWELKRDPLVATSLAAAMPSQDNLSFWPEWEKIVCPTLVLHGRASDLLSPATLVKMQQIHPPTEVIEISDAGHSPYLYRPAHLDGILHFLQLEQA